MGDMMHFPGAGSPVLRRPSGVIRVNRAATFDASGARIGSSQGKLVVLKEFNFLGLNNGTGSIVGASAPVVEGIQMTCYANGSGGGVECSSGGIKFTSPSTAGQEVGMYTATGALKPVIGDDRWRRGRLGFWCRINSYSFPAGVFFYAPLVDFDYADAGWFNRRARSINSTTNDATGGWAGGGWYAGAEGTGVQRNGASASEDVSLLYFRSPWEIDHYRGFWSNETGWPLMENMTYGGMTRAFAGVMTRYDATVARLKMNTLAGMRFMCGGGQSANNACWLTIERMRVTAWD
jgi:hypothetical protein